MRISRVHIRGFRCLDDLLIEFDNVTVFVGANSTGKSSVLHALDWFFTGGNLHGEDVAGLDPDGVVSVAVTFTDLSGADLEKFGTYVADGEMTLWRTWSPVEAEKLTGRALALPAFEKVRANEKKSDLNAAYRELREAQPDLELPAARSADVATDAMRAWEQDHPDRLEPSTVSATHLFGFAGHGKLAGRFDYVLIPAASDPESETRDSRGTLLRQLVDRTGKQSETMRNRLEELEANLASQVEQIVREEGLDTFRDVSRVVTAELALLVPDGTVTVEPRPPTVRIPEVGFDMRVADGGIETGLGHQGHGFQRALFIALARQLAEADTEGDPPGLFVGIEEPELYQHPVQARHFCRTLAELAQSGSSIQVAYATHSEHFVDPSHYERLRRFTKSQSTRDWPTATVTSATESGVASRLDGIVDQNQVALRVRITLRRQLAEAVFAKAVLLVEGPTDAGMMHGLADRRGGFDASGVAVVQTGGKHRMLVPLAILAELGVPVFTLFDGDADLEERMQRNGKNDSDIRSAVDDSRRHNRQLLKMLGGDAADQPPDEVKSARGTFQQCLEDVTGRWNSFRQRYQELLEEDGDWRGDKSEDAYRLAAAEAPDDPPRLLDEMVSAIVARANPAPPDG